MNQECGRKLQEKIALEAIAGITLAGSTADVSAYEEAVRLIGKAWQLPQPETCAQLDLIAQEREAARHIEAGEAAIHAVPDKDLLVSWSGMETLGAIQDMFETSLHLDTFEERQKMFQLTMTLIESQGLLEWIEKTPEEKRR